MPRSFIEAVLNDRIRGWRLFFFPSGGTFPGIMIPFRDDDDHNGRRPDYDDWEDPPARRRKNGSRPE